MPYFLGLVPPEMLGERHAFQPCFGSGGDIRQQLQECLALLGIGGFHKHLPIELEVLSMDELFHFRLSRKGSYSRRSVQSVYSYGRMEERWRKASLTDRAALPVFNIAHTAGSGAKARA
jgi:hypothetical protein